eukprot:contig_1875_g306
MATTTVSAAVTRLLASADLSAVTVKTLVAQVREQLPDVGAMGDKPLRRAVREAVEAYLATDKKSADASGGGGGGGDGGDGGDDADVEGGSAPTAASKGSSGSAVAIMNEDTNEEGAATLSNKREPSPSAGDDAAASDVEGAVGEAAADSPASSDPSDGDGSAAVADRKRPDSGSGQRAAPAKKRRRTSTGGGGGGGGDDELSRLLDIVAAVGLSRRSAVLSVARLRDVEAKATRLRQMLADKAGMGDDPLKAGRAELAAAKREVERRDLLGGLDSGNIVSGGRRRRGAPVSYTDPAPADMLDKLLEEEEERAYAQDSAAVAGEKKPTGKPAVGRRVLGDGSNEEDADTAGAKQDKTAEPSGEVGAPAAEADSAVVDNEPVRGQEADGKAPQSGADDGSDAAGDDADAGQEEQEEDEDSDDDDDDDDFSAGDMSEDNA